nr:immunoglobulin light chain junction region [Macaca mulatta]MOW02118.1 immunoglobulin light chain junction region [Macaca mulatta]MOW02153.1 immunoglobulin light chain junction region [Macaca mulatta]MOW02208.1 immunoglobulin light chain junction region [Macaca mulatta]MOW02214.1 immunoglobulin light chain junction region [Macaca mulatta]
DYYCSSYAGGNSGLF